MKRNRHTPNVEEEHDEGVTVRNVIDKSGGRKFFMVLTCAIICTGLLIWGFIPPEIFRDLIIATVSVFLGANVYQKVGEMKHDNYRRYGNGDD